MELSSSDFKFLTDTIKGYSGISLSEDKGYLLESRLAPVATKYGLNSLKNLVDYIKENKDESLLIEIIEAMTTNESFFFRDTKPFECLCKHIIPNILKKNPGKDTIKIWSAACSTGQEPYSIAISMLEDPALSGLKYDIKATDLDFNVIEKAKEGLYTQFEVQRGMPITMLIKYFNQEGDQWRVKDNVRTNINFDKFNLLDNAGNFGKFDIIFCRNVLIYFEPDTKEQVVHNLSNCMDEHSYLLLGSTESVIGMNTDLKSTKSDDGASYPGVFCFD